MTEHGDTGLEAGCLLDPGAERIAHTLLGKLHVTECVAFLRTGGHRHRRLERPHLHAFGDDDDAEVLAFAPTVMQMLDDGVELRWKLGDDDHVGAPCQAAHHRNPAGVASHHLHHHDAVVRGRRRVQSIQRLNDDPDRRVEADAKLGDREVIVDRLGDTHHRIASIAHRGGDGERVVAANRNQAVDARGAQQADHLLDPALLLQGIGPRGAQDGPTQWKNAAYRRRC